jgi:uncharacterized protein YegP (UPF0339 family)
MRLAKYEIFVGKDYDYYWRLRAANGEIVCVSEGYMSPHNARRGARTARRLSRFALITKTIRTEQ